MAKMMADGQLRDKYDIHNDNNPEVISNLKILQEADNWL
jgi:hypothetical protein